MDAYEEIIEGYRVSEINEYLEERSDQYIDRIRELQNRKHSFNFCAFFFGELWFAYRKMWQEGLIFLLIDQVSNIVIGAMVLELIAFYPEYDNSFLVLIFCPFLIAKRIFVGYWGDEIYWRNIKKKMDTYRQLVEMEHSDPSIEPGKGVSKLNIFFMILIHDVCAGITSAVINVIGEIMVDMML